MLVFITPALNGVIFRDMVLNRLVLSIYESLTVNICKITSVSVIRAQQGSLCRSFPGCNHVRVIISKIMHVISLQVTCFFSSPRFEVLRADFHSNISGNRSYFCNLFFVMDNFYSCVFDHNFLFDVF